MRRLMVNGFFPPSFFLFLTSDAAEGSCHHSSLGYGDKHSMVVRGGGDKGVISQQLSRGGR